MHLSVVGAARLACRLPDLASHRPLPNIVAQSDFCSPSVAVTLPIQLCQGPNARTVECCQCSERLPPTAHVVRARATTTYADNCATLLCHVLCSTKSVVESRRAPLAIPQGGPRNEIENPLQTFPKISQFPNSLNKLHYRHTTCLPDSVTHLITNLDAAFWERLAAPLWRCVVDKPQPPMNQAQANTLSRIQPAGLGSVTQKVVEPQSNSILAALTDQRRKLTELEETINRLRSAIEPVSRPPSPTDPCPMCPVPGGSQVWSLIQDGSRTLDAFIGDINDIIQRLEVA